MTLGYMKKVSGLTKLLRSAGIVAGSVLGSIGMSNESDAALVQWRNRVPASETVVEDTDLPSIGSGNAATIEIGNGGTKNYDSGLDFDLDTSILPNDHFFVTYVEHNLGQESESSNLKQVEYEFTQDLLPGESYTTKLSFENRTGNTFFTPNTIEFLRADGNFSYDLQVDKWDDGEYTYFDSGTIEVGELSPWTQLINLGQDWRNGWTYGTLTITALENEPEPLLGDGNGDGVVDTADYQVWKDHFGEVLGDDDYPPGDYNLDHTTDLADYTVWRNNLGASTAPIAAASIPEPAALTLLTLAASLIPLATPRRAPLK